MKQLVFQVANNLSNVELDYTRNKIEHVQTIHKFPKLKLSEKSANFWKIYLKYIPLNLIFEPPFLGHILNLCNNCSEESRLDDCGVIEK